MRFLITGGAGFIGSHLCDFLVTQNKKVTILDNLTSGSKKNISHLEGKIKVILGDICDQRLVDQLVLESDVVLHMAAVLGVENILRHPIEAITTNVYGSKNVLQSAAKYHKRIIIASTSEIYGKSLNQPLSELDDRVIGSPQKLRWSYSDAKALEEAMAHWLYLSQGLKVTTVRFFNTVGPRQTGKYGMVIPRFISAAMSDLPIRIFGSGEQSRVFCHVRDAVSAVINLINNDNSIGEVFNIGGIEEISIRKLGEKIVNLTKSSSELSFIPYEEAYLAGFEDMHRRVPDLNKIKKYINWVPQISLDQVIEDIIQEYKN
jgi:UDP-glucose 4-epimerase